SEFLGRYPHELSGGQLQRVGLAIAFACRPRVIVLDEPTTGLDVTTQAHVLGTVRELVTAHGVAALYVSHDLAVVGTLASRAAVLFCAGAVFGRHAGIAIACSRPSGAVPEGRRGTKSHARPQSGWRWRSSHP